jgi:excinuclease ABC subunit C
MDGLFDNPRMLRVLFTGFGPSPCAPRRAIAETIELSDDVRDVRKLLRAQCPCRPGVYGMLDAAGELIYVGMSARLRDRLLTYFTKGRPGAKEPRIAAHAARLVWELGDHELTVQLRELELIRHWRPRFNARGRPGRHEIGYIYLAAGEAPNLRAGRRVPQAAQHCWGPLPLNRRVRAAVQQLNYLFQLRDCPDRTPMRYAEQMTLLVHDGHPACLRGEIGTCLAPCSGQRTRQDYGQRIAAARALLDGRDTTMIDRYELAMQDAADRRAFEQAATYRNLWEQLTLLHDQLQLLRSAQRDYWFVYPVQGCSATHTRATIEWMLIAGGTLVAVLREPRTPAAARRCLGLLEQTFADRQFPVSEDYDQIRLVAAWFRQHPDERGRILDPDQAQAICRERTEESPCVAP